MFQSLAQKDSTRREQADQKEKNGKRYTVKTLTKRNKKIDFKTRSIIRCKEGHYITMKRSIQEKGITVLN